MLTGLYPLSHGVHHKDLSLSDDHRTLAEHFNDHGLRTAAYLNSGYLKKRSGLQQGFETYTYFKEVEDSPVPSAGWRIAKRWISDHRDERFFLFLHIYDPHSAYMAKAPHHDTFADAGYSGSFVGKTSELIAVRQGAKPLNPVDIQHLKDRYDENLLQTDAELGGLLEHIEQLNLTDNTLIVVTSDHGEMLGEYGEVLHGRTHYQEVLHVPWVAAGPNIAPGQLPTPVSTVDLAPTLATWMGLPFTHTIDGRDLTRDLNPNGTIFAEADQNGAHHHQLRTVRQGQWKLTRNIITGEEHLVNLQHQADESTPVEQSDNVPIKQLQRHLDLHVSGDKPTANSAPPLTEMEQKQLEALGYLEGEPKR